MGWMSCPGKNINTQEISGPLYYMFINEKMRLFEFLGKRYGSHKCANLGVTAWMKWQFQAFILFFTSYGNYWSAKLLCTCQMAKVDLRGYIGYWIGQISLH